MWPVAVAPNVQSAGQAHFPMSEMPGRQAYKIGVAGRLVPAGITKPAWRRDEDLSELPQVNQPAQ